MKRAVFLDRDGTLNEDPGYLHDPAQLRLFPGAGRALRSLKDAGYLLIVVSNQSGVARGLIDPQEIPRINQRMDELLIQDGGVKIDDYRLCFHHPDEDCPCRKPRPLLLKQASDELGIDLSQSFMIGDKVSDLGAGKAAHCQASILVRTGAGIESEKIIGSPSKEADHVADSIIDAAEWILSKYS